MKRLLIVSVAILAGAASVSYATTVLTTATDVIQACTKGDGQLRIIDSSSSCKQNETPISWNVQGPQGPPGGPAQAFYARNCCPVPSTLPAAGTSASIVHVDLPAGSYTLTGKVMLQRLGSPDGQAIVTCVLAGDSPGFVLKDQTIPLPMVSAVTLSAPGRVDLSCQTDTAGASVFVYGAGLVASSVGTLTGP
jgi:hypothetical protein